MKKHNVNIETSSADRHLTVEGVGEGSQECSTKAMVPMVLASGDTGTFQTPVIPNSDVPALLGMKTLEHRRELLGIHGRKLYFITNCNYTI